MKGSERATKEKDGGLVSKTNLHLSFHHAPLTSSLWPNWPSSGYVATAATSGGYKWHCSVKATSHDLS